MMATGVFLSNTESYKYQIINKYLCGKLYRDEAAKLLNVSARTISRYASKVKHLGIFGVKHGNSGNDFNKKYPDELKNLVINLKRTKYFDYNTTHFHEILTKDHKIDITYVALWRWLSKSKLVKQPRRSRRKKHTFRTRMPQEGLLLQMDGCHHKWNGADEWCLISAIDDATSSIPYAEFFKGETTLSCMAVLKKIIEIKGVPKAIYTDRAGWSGGQKRTEFSNFKKACDKLGIQLIFANSPEAKGRIERSFRTFQDRLVPELRSAGIKTMADGNKYLNEVFLKEYWNKQNIIEAFNKEVAYESLSPWTNLDDVLCIIEDRKIGSDQTTSFGSTRYVIKGFPGSAAGYNAEFRITLNGELKVFVMDQEVEIEAVTARLYDLEQPKAGFTIDDGKMYSSIALKVSRLASAVWEHKVTGKPLRLGKKSKKAG